MHSDRQIHPAMLAALVAIGALSVLGYSYVSSRPDAARSEAKLAVLAPPPSVPALSASDQSVADAAPAESARSDESVAPSSESADESSPEPSPEDVARWVADTTGADPRRRATAIVALGTAPTSDALPALASLLDTADEGERSLALASMRTLAKDQGDHDGRIRDVVRKTIYHGSDEAVTSAARVALDDIEHELN